MVAQLLALLDGLESRAGAFVLATTNRPDSIDSALRRPGRFDCVVWMKLPNERGRAAILRYYLKPLKIEPGIDIDALVANLAAATDGASGADLEYLCQTAARMCVKKAISTGASPDDVRIFARHFALALSSLGHSGLDGRNLQIAGSGSRSLPHIPFDSLSTGVARASEHL